MAIGGQIFSHTLAEDTFTTFRTQLRGIIDGATVVINIRLELRFAGGGNGAAAAVSADTQPGVTNVTADYFDRFAFEFAPPRRNRAKAGAGDGLDGLVDRRLIAERGGIDGTQIQPASQCSHFVATP